MYAIKSRINIIAHYYIIIHKKEKSIGTIDETRVLTKESPIWEMHSQDELKLSHGLPPLNGFEEMIKLTNEGKVWKFPIDNEQGNYYSSILYFLSYRLD